MQSRSQHRDLTGLTLAQGRYRVLGHLGQGSMAFVYRAYDNRLETDVVIKVPTPEKAADAEFRIRFQRESQLLVRLTHPHVVKILDVGDHNGLPFVVMQFLSGGTLKDRFPQRSASHSSDTIPAGHAADEAGMPVTSLKTWVREVSRAIDFVNAQDIIHRDVKPANILFDEHGNAYLSDFGLTKIMYGDHRDLNSEMTGAGFVVGTPNYVAPEIVLGQRYDGRADQYSLGITVYHALIGRAPMQGPSSAATMVNQTQKKLPLLCDVRSDISRPLAMAIDRAISKQPKDRFDKCEDFAEAVLLSLAPPVRTVESADSQPGNSPDVDRTPRRKVNNPHARMSAQAAGQSVSEDVLQSALPSGKHRVGGRRKSGSGISRGVPGAVKCPQCRRVLPLKPVHAGRIGRCIHCRTKLRVSQDLATLTKFVPNAENADWYSGNPSGLPPRKRRTAGASASAVSDSSDLILGEKVFRWRIRKETAIAISVVLLMALIGSTVYLTLFMNSKSTEEILQERVDAIRTME
ncbi:MAG: serine/threonine protein kinase [Planctomycetaceae bacterium]|nr:serine/threonine protein kinase [Planctomycetaceae bacterium]